MRYQLGTTEADRREADDELRICVLIRAGRAWSGIYYRAVKRFGGKAFAEAKPHPLAVAIYGDGRGVRGS